MVATQSRAARKAAELTELASARFTDGMYADAMDDCIRSLQTLETPAARALFVRLVRSGTNFSNGSVRQYLIRALSDPWCRTGQLVPACLALIKSGDRAGPCIERAVAAWPATLSKVELFGVEGLAALASDDLLAAVLVNTPAAAPDFERFVTLARRAMLLDVAAAPAAHTSDASLLRFCCAVARQCHTNEYVYYVAPDERDAVAGLRESISARLAAAQSVPGAWIAVLACYSPLSSLPESERLAASMKECPLAGLFVQQVKEPMQEEGIRATLQSLTQIDDATSREVGSQYEDHPYPRWVRTPSIESTLSFGAFLADELGVDPGRFAHRSDRVDVLIAGCGTGQQSIQTAQRFSAARILAVDLSKASLAYAKRKTRELRITNIDYARADILALETLGRTFDYIESVGVLHHLDDPIAGWRVLRSLLRPGGIMHVGLYSALARRDIARAQDFVKTRGDAPTTEGIRQFRFDLQTDDTCRAFRWLTALEDFYDTSGCRDLLFHVREHCFALPQIREALGKLELDFLKFNVDAAVQQRFARQYPGELARSDLNCWTQFEAENPGTFLGMYNFFARAREL
jgi:SAM-dependent methyltransferase